MRLGRVDVSFSNKDKALWDFIENIDKGDRGYWLKYYAAIGIAVSKNNEKQQILVKPIEIHTSSKNGQKKRSRKETKKTDTPESIAQENVSQPIIRSEPLPDVQPLDPMEKRRSAMGSMLSPDEDLLKLFDDTNSEVTDP